MALDPILWAMKDAPTANVEEWAILTAMAESADEDGCNAFQSTGTIAERTKLSERTVQRRIDDLLERRLIGLGDQEYPPLLRIPPHRRTTNYDVLIPANWYGNLDRVNDYRARLGRPPLSTVERPDLPPPPPKGRRKDAGTKRATQTTEDAGRGDYKSPPDLQSPLPPSPPRGDSRSRGDYQSGEGRPVVTQPSPSTPPSRTTAPSLRSEADGGPGGPTSMPVLPAVDEVGQGLLLVPDPPAVPAVPSPEVLAKAVAGEWLNRWADHNHAPRPSGKSREGKLTALSRTIAPQLGDGYALDEIKAALAWLNEVCPSKPQFERRLAQQRRTSVPGSAEGPYRNDQAWAGMTEADGDELTLRSLAESMVRHRQAASLDEAMARVRADLAADEQTPPSERTAS